MSGARSGSGTRLLPDHFGAFRYPMRRRKGPSAEFQCGAHAGARAVRAHVVVELRERRQHPFHQLAGGRVVDRLGRRPQGDAEGFQVRAERKVVVLLAGEPREVVHDHEVNLALVRPAVLQQILKLTAVRGLGALAFFVEPFEDLVALAAAILFAGAQLRWQAEVLGLLLRADANVDHRADHQRQIRPNRGRGQGVSRRHGDYPEI